jgi:hypothetical protein
MANQQHVRILAEGVKIWNRWREKNPEIKPDLSDAELRRLNLRQANFKDTNLHRAHLREADLSWANGGSSRGGF